MATLLAAAAACAVVLSGLVAAVSYRTTSPPWYEHRRPEMGLRPLGPGVAFGRDPLADLGLEYREIALATAEGATLRGWLIPAPAGAGGDGIGVVTAHGRAGDRRDLLPQAAVFHELGATVLLFDFRDHGVSDGAGRGMSMGYREAQDVSAAVRYMKEDVGLRRVVVAGVSLGAASAILAAAGDPAIDAVIADSALTSFEDFLRDQTAGEMWSLPLLRSGPAALRPPLPPVWPRLVTTLTAWRSGAWGLAAPADVVACIAPRPILLIHGAADSIVSPDHAAALYLRAGTPKAKWVVSGAEHTMAYSADPTGYREQVADLLRRTAA